jgi:clan AA aspartic protease (TIGR02281 family)
MTPLEEDTQATESSSLLPRAAWLVGRVLVTLLSGLLTAHWLGGFWSSGWFQFTAALVLCVGLPVGFHLLIRRQIMARGGDARFQLLTVMAVLNTPGLLWTAAQHPAVYVDAVRDEGLGSLEWAAIQVGAREQIPAADSVDEDAASAAIEGEVASETSAEATVAHVEGGEAPAPVADHVAEGGTASAVLEFESRSGQMVIPAAVNGQPPMSFVLDTGASYSTLDQAALTTLGIEVPADAPVRTIQTAGGESDGRLVLVDSVDVGGQRREGVAFWVCEPCAVGETVGLMGLNVWQGYLLTIDPLEQTVQLQPRTSPMSRTVDVEPFVDIEATSSRMADGQLIVDLSLTNRSRRPVRQAVLLVTALDAQGREVGAFTVDAGEVPAQQSKATSGSMPQAIQVDQVRLELLDAWW